MHLKDLTKKGMYNVFSVILGLLIFRVIFFMPWPCLPSRKALAKSGGRYFPAAYGLVKFL